MESDNRVSEPDNQQGRLESYLSGFADGEGTFSVGATRRPDLLFGFQLVPEFRVSQNEERASVLHVFQRELGCGRIVENHRTRANDRSLVLVVRKRLDLLTKVIPFFRRNPLLLREAKRFRAIRRGRRGPRPRRPHDSERLRAACDHLVRDERRWSIPQNSS